MIHSIFTDLGPKISIPRRRGGSAARCELPYDGGIALMAYTTLSYLGERLHLLERGDDESTCPDEATHAGLAFTKPLRISRLLQAAQRDPHLMMRLRRLALRHGWAQGVFQLSDAEFLRRIKSHLESGRLRVVPCGRVRGAIGGGPAAEADDPDSDRNDNDKDRDDNPPPPRKPTKTWVEIELKYWDGTPAANERYEIELPDGSVNDGRLDAEGRARFTGIDPGTCQVTFPDYDGQEWSSV